MYGSSFSVCVCVCVCVRARTRAHLKKPRGRGQLSQTYSSKYPWAVGWWVSAVFLRASLDVSHFLQPMCRKCHSRCLFLRLGRSRVSPTNPWVQIHARVALERGLCACEQLAGNSLPLSRTVPATSGTPPSARHPRLSISLPDTLHGLAPFLF